MGGERIVYKQIAGTPDSPEQAQTDCGHPETARTNMLRAAPDAKQPLTDCYEKQRGRPPTGGGRAARTLRATAATVRPGSLGPSAGPGGCRLHHEDHSRRSCETGGERG